MSVFNPDNEFIPRPGTENLFQSWDPYGPMATYLLYSGQNAAPWTQAGSSGPGPGTTVGSTGTVGSNTAPAPTVSPGDAAALASKAGERQRRRAALGNTGKVQVDNPSLLQQAIQLSLMPRTLVGA